MQNKIQIYQIFYDQQSLSMLDSNFIPLDNTENLRPDWFEFYPIRNYLMTNTLEENCWYGFFSPKFIQKTKINPLEIYDMLEKYGSKCDVALFSDSWDQLAYFLNPFEQGEMWHPGLTKLTQAFLDHECSDVDLSSLVTYSSTSVFSNYIVAKSNFWAKWLQLSNNFFSYVESNPLLQGSTSYGSMLHQAPMKTFIQERFPSLILPSMEFKVLTPDHSLNKPISSQFENSSNTRRTLQTLDLLKEKYCSTKMPQYLEMFYTLRRELKFNKGY